MSHQKILVKICSHAHAHYAKVCTRVYQKFEDAYGSQGPGQEKSWQNVTFFLKWEAGMDRLKQKFT